MHSLKGWNMPDAGNPISGGLSVRSAPSYGTRRFAHKHQLPVSQAEYLIRQYGHDAKRLEEAAEEIKVRRASYWTNLQKP